MDKIIHQKIDLPLTADEAYRFFTENSKLERWLAARAEVVAKVGGGYELFWNPEDRENDSTLGCRILVAEPGELLSFEWKGASQFKHFMNQDRPLTTVTVSFLPLVSGKTRVHLVHTGWRDSNEWEQARLWFVQAWQYAFGALATATAS